MFQTKKRLKISLIVIAVIIILIMLLAPAIIKSYAINNSKELAGRQINIGTLKYNFFSSTARVYDFTMYEANDTDKFISFDTLIINLEPYRFLFGEKNIEQFYVKGLEVNIIMKDSTFNFDDLVAFHAETTTDSIPPDDEEAFKYDLSELELNDAFFYFDNKNVDKLTSIENFSFFIPQIVWDQSEKSNADVAFDFKNGGSFSSKLNINPANGEFDAEVTIEKLYLDSFYEYAAQYAEINEFNGLVNSNIHIVGNTDDVTKAIVSGQVDVSDFIMTDTNDKAFLKADLARVNLDKIDYTNSAYTFGTIDITKPYIYFEMDSITNNYFQIFKLDEEEEENTPEAIEQDSSSNSSLYYAINNLKVTNGLMDYTDNLTGERFDYHLNNIEIDSDPIKSDSKWISLDADMLLNNRGTLKSQLGVNPNAYDNLDLNIVVENFLLSDINVYANYYTGHNILLGDFYYYAKTKITNGDIQSDNQLLVKNVSVENSKSGIATLPLKFALFLLKDKNGDVNLNVPVRGDLNDPEINIGKLIWTTIKNKITGAASDPIESLAVLVDVDPADYRELTFEYTDTIPNEEITLKLDKLLEMESAKEGLKVQLDHQVDTKLQMKALAVEALGQKYNSEKNKDYKKNERAFRRYIRKETENDTISIEAAALMLVPESELESLAISYQQALRRNINSYLTQKKPNTSIRALISEKELPKDSELKNILQINFDMLTVMADTASMNSMSEADQK